MITLNRRFWISTVIVLVVFLIGGVMYKFILEPIVFQAKLKSVTESSQRALFEYEQIEKTRPSITLEPPPLVKEAKAELSSISLDKILKDDTLTTKELVQLARKYSLVGDYDSAVKILKKALKQQPDSAEIYERLGSYYKDMADYEQSVAAYQRAIQLDPKNKLAYYDLYDIYYFKLRDRTRAKKLLKKLLEIDNNDKFALMQMQFLQE